MRIILRNGDRLEAIPLEYPPYTTSVGGEIPGQPRGRFRDTGAVDPATGRHIFAFKEIPPRRGTKRGVTSS
jgi:hypothetical protein